MQRLTSLVSGVVVLVLVTVLLRCAERCGAADTTTVGFTLTMPNQTYPVLGEYWEGTITYNSTLDPQVAQPQLPQGYDLIAMTGTRTVWTADPSEPSSYHWNSTANIVGLLPAPRCYFIYNSSLPLASGVQSIYCVSFDVYSSSPFAFFYGAQAVFGVYDLSNYSIVLPDGTRPFPFLDLQYTNLLYPLDQVPDGMDDFGWAVALDSWQPGTLNASVDPRYPGYDFVVRPSSFGPPSEGGDIADQIQNNYIAADDGYESTAYGFAGTLVLTPLGSSTVLGDPLFVGLRGQQYQVHGIDGQVYSLIMDHDLRVNARFTFLAAGRCPALPSASSICWSHPGSYLGEIGLVTASGDRLVIASGSWQTGFERVTLNDQQLRAGESISTAAISLSFTSAFSLTVSAGNFELTLENSDGFVNMVKVAVKEWSELSSHGLLGQTWKRPAEKGRDIQEIEGWVEDYAEQDNDLLGSAFRFKPFSRQ